ncbi:hypothetical protein QM012_006533 [Aureobasidium pullulans]|uniref:Ribosomal RNA-processing protein 42 n=1 Tax=Aureobasidium pullulans TaxID=5580 RepID=A0ABR0TNT7_AURPU
MAPTSANLSPAELSYLHKSLSQTPPIRPDGRSPTQFRPLIAESEILPSANGSARICFADGTEAVVGIKAEVEKSAGFGRDYAGETEKDNGLGTAGGAEIEMGGMGKGDEANKGRDTWIEVQIEMPGYRDDDALPVFLGAMLRESLLATDVLKDRLYINRRFHWRLYIDILLLSAPLSYPLPLLSLTTHLALQHTNLPALISEQDEDPLFNDDWDAAVPLYPSGQKPPVTLLLASIGPNILFDPSGDELAVADSVVAVSVAPAAEKQLAVMAVRMVDPPSRLTGAGTPDVLNTATGGAAPTKAEALAVRETDSGVWRPPRGGVSRSLVARMIKMVVEKGGVGEEILEALDKVDT